MILQNTWRRVVDSVLFNIAPSTIYPNFVLASEIWSNIFRQFLAIVSIYGLRIGLALHVRS